MRQDKQKDIRTPSRVVLEEVDEQTAETQTRDESEENRKRQQQTPSVDETPAALRRRQGKLLARLRRLPVFTPSLVLENSGSVARDHLAAERTFLAYVRTSLGCAAAGVALVQLIAMTPTDVSMPLETFGKIIGAVTEVLGVGIMLIAVFRYFSMQRALIDGKFPPAGVVVWAIAIAMAVITCLTFGLMLAIAMS
ncbi:hypothetical protein ACEPAF_5290 [Sanghuangporus sanghuang]